MATTKKPRRGKRPRDEKRILIRSDGVLFNYTDALAARSDMKLHSGSAPTPAQVAKATGKDPDAFDVGKATKGQLVKFAKTEYDVVLDPAMGLGMLRSQVVALAAKAETEAAEQ